MTALSGTNVPTGIDTDAKLAVWLFSLLDRIYVGKEFQPTAAETAPRFVKSIYRDGQNNIVITFQGTIQLDPGVEAATTGQLWDYAEEVADVTIPTEYLA